MIEASPDCLAVRGGLGAIMPSLAGLGCRSMAGPSRSDAISAGPFDRAEWNEDLYRQVPLTFTAALASFLHQSVNQLSFFKTSRISSSAFFDLHSLQVKIIPLYYPLESTCGHDSNRCQGARADLATISNYTNGMTYEFVP